MAKYIVQEMSIIHGAKGDKEASLYEPGAEIELTAAEAAALGSNVIPVDEEGAKGYDSMTKAELVNILEGKVEIPANANKPTLVELAGLVAVLEGKGVEIPANAKKDELLALISEAEKK
jgi:hypothetical protein